MANTKLFFHLINLYLFSQKIFPIIRTTSGRVRGKTFKINNSYVEQYLNIPYAEPPVGRLRFSKPLALKKPIKGIIDGTRSGNACFQLDAFTPLTVPQSEDCLTLNIWTNNVSDGLKPVLVYMHGGVLEFGTAYSSTLNGSVLAKGGLVVVTANYRVGPFGWLYGGEDSAPGNVGLYDQFLALHWVKNNIRSFGGDQNQVTFNGQSAGGWTVSASIVSPLSKGLFNRAILQSGTSFQNKDTPVLPKSVALSEAKGLAKYVNCWPNNQWLDCIRGVDPKIIYSYRNLTSYLIFGTEILPFSPQNAFQTQFYRSEIDLMVGTVPDEGKRYTIKWFPKAYDMHSSEEFRDLVQTLSSFRNFPFHNLNFEKITEFYLKNVNSTDTNALMKAFNSLYGDLSITCSLYFFTKQFAEHSPQTNVFFYYWTYASSQISSSLGCTEIEVCHASEIRYIFGEPFLNSTSDLVDKNLSEYAMKLWTNFVKFGNPVENDQDNVWPRFYDTFVNPVVKIKEINPFRLNHIFINLFENNCEYFWKNYFV